MAKKINAFLCVALTCILSCSSEKNEQSLNTNQTSGEKAIKLIVLGNVQDGGSPHIGCEKKCCKELSTKEKNSRRVVSLGLIDQFSKKKYIIEATPDFTEQLNLLDEHSGFNTPTLVDGVFISHAHIGHYTGLMYLGKEAMGASEIPVYVMPKMRRFLKKNGPWSQLVELKNIDLKKLQRDKPVQLGNSLAITPIKVPHRDEFSETVGFIISGPNKKALFIPDIDKWSKWERHIKSIIKKVDYAFLDATFYNQEEIPHRDMAAIPHPFVVESMELFADLAKTDRAKVHFIHLNHSNPLLNEESKASKKVLSNGFKIARNGLQLSL